MDDVGVDQQLRGGGVKQGFGGKGQQVLPSQNKCLDLRMQAERNVPQVVGQPQSLVHTGMASANTSPRNLSGRALGVSTSTDTPKSFSSST